MWKAIKNQDPYFYLFSLFLIFTIIFIFSPVIIYIPSVKNFIRIFIKELYNYKQTYLSIFGTTLGAGLAVSSAVWLQRNNIIKKEKEEKATELFKQKQAAKVIKNWATREISMLWGMWIWAKFDMSVYIDDGTDLPFEPYCIDKNKVLNCYLLIDHKLSDSSSDTFYELYYLAEKVNQYIECYNRMNYDILEIESNGLPNGNIGSRMRKNSSSQRYREILRFIVNDKRKFLFFDNNFDTKNWEKHFQEKSILQKNLNELENELLKAYQEHVYQGRVNEKDYFNDLIQTSKWTEHKVETPEKYKSMIQKIDKAKEAINKLTKNYEGTKEKYYGEVEKPLMSLKINGFSIELSQI